jgi:7-cyano-7-deazaguanine reductase
MALDEAPDYKVFEVFPNPNPGRDYEILISCPEFTSVCPKTGHPDFGTITFNYVPAQNCIELKSLKIYLQSFRNVGMFYEYVSNKILDDFVKAVEPKSAKITGDFTARGGITTKISINYIASKD